MLEGFEYQFSTLQVSLCAEGPALRRVLFGPLPEDTRARESAVITMARHQIEEYFAGKRQRFDVPLAFPKATPFQMAVWQALRDIPYGQTRSYGDIARLTGCQKASRAVGAAAHVNPFAIIIPCHRVIGANGALTGFAAGLAVKKALLQLEASGAGLLGAKG